MIGFVERIRHHQEREHSDPLKSVEKLIDRHLASVSPLIVNGEILRSKCLYVPASIPEGWVDRPSVSNDDRLSPCQYSEGLSTLPPNRRAEFVLCTDSPTLRISFKEPVVLVVDDVRTTGILGRRIKAARLYLSPSHLQKTGTQEMWVYSLVFENHPTFICSNGLVSPGREEKILEGTKTTFRDCLMQGVLVPRAA